MRFAVRLIIFYCPLAVRKLNSNIKITVQQTIFAGFLLLWKCNKTTHFGLWKLSFSIIQYNAQTFWLRICLLYNDMWKLVQLFALELKFLLCFSSIDWLLIQLRHIFDITFLRGSEVIFYVCMRVTVVVHDNPRHSEWHC